MITIKGLSSELKNSRKAIGFLKYKSEEKEFNGNKFMMFVIRQVTKKGKWYKVIEYSFSASGSTMDDLKYIDPNVLVHVTFEIRSKEKEPGWYTTGLRATDIFPYGDEAPQWFWEIKDGMIYSDLKEIKESFNLPPALSAILKSNPSDRPYHIKDYEYNTFNKRELKKPIEQEDDEDDIPPF